MSARPSRKAVAAWGQGDKVWVNYSEQLHHGTLATKLTTGNLLFPKWTVAFDDGSTGDVSERLFRTTGPLLGELAQGDEELERLRQVQTTHDDGSASPHGQPGGKLPIILGNRELFHANTLKGAGYHSALGNNKLKLQWTSNKCNLSMWRWLPMGPAPDAELDEAWRRKDGMKFSKRATELGNAAAAKGQTHQFVNMHKGDVIMTHHGDEYVLGVVANDSTEMIEATLQDLGVHICDEDPEKDPAAPRLFRRVKWQAHGSRTKLSEATASYLKGFMTSTCQRAKAERKDAVYADLLRACIDGTPLEQPDDDVDTGTVLDDDTDAGTSFVDEDARGFLDAPEDGNAAVTTEGAMSAPQQLDNAAQITTAHIQRERDEVRSATACELGLGNIEKASADSPEAPPEDMRPPADVNGADAASNDYRLSRTRVYNVDTGESTVEPTTKRARTEEPGVSALQALEQVALITVAVKQERDDAREATDEAQDLANSLVRSENAKMTEIDKLRALAARCGAGPEEIAQCRVTP
jgi:hypothetical protein